MLERQVAVVTVSVVVCPVSDSAFDREHIDHAGYHDLVRAEAALPTV
jgi:hypothetical protein